MKTGTPICSKRSSSSARSCFASMRSSVEICSTVRSWASRAARSRSPRVAGGGGGLGSLGCSLSDIAGLLRVELQDLGRPREAAAQLRRAPVRRRRVVERALDVDARQQHRRGRGTKGEITLHERARLKIFAALRRQLEHVQQRVGVARIALQRRAETLFGRRELARVARATTRVRQRDFRRAVLLVLGGAAKIRLSLGPAIAVSAQESR